MNATHRNAALFVGLFVAVYFVASYASLAWFKTFISDRTFAVSLGWIHWPMLLSWVPAIVIFAAAGFTLALFLRSTRVAYWAVALGALYSVIQISMSSYQFMFDVGLFEYFWVFAGYAVPPLASVAGALYAQHHAVQRRYP
jgi:hypothetical protein